MTKMKGVVHKFYSDLYREYVLITFDKDKFCRMTGTGDLSHAGGCVAIIPGHPLVMWLDMDAEGKLDMTDCAHESFHVADFILDNKGMEYCHDTGNEHMAYLIGWVMGCVLEAQYSQQINDGHVPDPRSHSSCGVSMIEIDEDTDIHEMLERAAREWDEQFRLDPELEVLLNPKSKM